MDVNPRGILDLFKGNVFVQRMALRQITGSTNHSWAPEVGRICRAGERGDVYVADHSFTG